MKGYLKDPERTADAVVELDGMRWYKTGDKGHLDADGFLTIVDRYSRFAKLGGEMISLSAVEEQVRRALGLPELEVAAVNLPDERKGERILLLVAEDIERRRCARNCWRSGVNPLSIPSQVVRVEAIPKLGSGKTDFGAVRRLAIAALMLFKALLYKTKIFLSSIADWPVWTIVKVGNRTGGLP